MVGKMKLTTTRVDLSFFCIWQSSPFIHYNYIILDYDRNLWGVFTLRKFAYFTFCFD